MMAAANQNPQYAAQHYAAPAPQTVQYVEYAAPQYVMPQQYVEQYATPQYVHAAQPEYTIHYVDVAPHQYAAPPQYAAPHYEIPVTGFPDQLSPQPAVPAAQAPEPMPQQDPWVPSKNKNPNVGRHRKDQYHRPPSAPAGKMGMGKMGKSHDPYYYASGDAPPSPPPSTTPAPAGKEGKMGKKGKEGKKGGKVGDAAGKMGKMGKMG